VAEIYPPHLRYPSKEGIFHASPLGNNAIYCSLFTIH
jgi:hypothetical protein